MATKPKIEKEKAGFGSKAKSARLNVVLSADDKVRIDRIVELMGADTVTEATKDAFRLLEYFLNKSESGSKFFIKEPGEEISKLEIFGVTTK